MELLNCTIWEMLENGLEQQKPLPNRGSRTICTPRIAASAATINACLACLLLATGCQPWWKTYVGRTLPLNEVAILSDKCPDVPPAYVNTIAPVLEKVDDRRIIPLGCKDFHIAPGLRKIDLCYVEQEPIASGGGINYFGRITLRKTLYHRFERGHTYRIRRNLPDFRPYFKPENWNSVGAFITPNWEPTIEEVPTQP
jgi:hypothetical protein